MGWSSDSKISSASAGKGCSISSTRSCFSFGAIFRKCSAVHDSFASISSRAFGASSWTASTRVRSASSPPSLSLKIDAIEFAAAARILSGVSRLMVKEVSTSGTIGTRANSQTRLPERFASKSQNPQSNALRAAPAGNNFCNFCRSRSLSSLIDSIWARTDSGVWLYRRIGTASPWPACSP